MDIFLYNLDANISEKRLRQYLRGKFHPFGVDNLHLEKLSRGKCALLTVLDVAAGQRFLKHYSDPKTPLRLSNRTIRCRVANAPPDELKIRVLKKTISDSVKRANEAQPGERHPPLENRQFHGVSLACGSWDYSRDELVFVSHYIDHGGFVLCFGRREMVIVMRPKLAGGPYFRVDISYSSMQSIVYKGLQDTIITFTLYSAPRIYLVELKAAPDGVNVQSKKVRVPGVSAIHQCVSGHCFVYQLVLHPGEVRAVRNLLAFKPYVPKAASWPFKLLPMKTSFVKSMQDLHLLFQHRNFENLSFGVKFQVQRLAQNGFLPPSLTAAFLPVVSKLAKRRGMDTTVQTLQKLFQEIPFAGPESEAECFTVAHLEHELLRLEKIVLREPGFNFAVAKRHNHLALVHRVRVTPTGMYLEGPELEPKNHVLRTHEHRATDAFLRVSFEEEDGDGIRFDPNGNLEVIHHGRFKTILESKISIAGRQFSFLGFSHSSLREQSCWFVTPFVHEGGLLTPSALVKKLGDFSAIQCPAKCAARIGQNFTDLNSFVSIPVNAVQRVRDVERNGRVFSDGCSAVSLSIIKTIWKNYDLLSFKATVFQIRLGGIKGMVSLDPRLKGDVLQVRPSQDKFPADVTNLGICGVAKRTLPFYLNRPMVKVLEDLGVKTASFEALQAQAIRKLREIAESPINAAAFLERNDVGNVANLPWLFERLFYMGISVFEDQFLWSIVELTVLTNLRDLKYRMRIPVEKGVTVYGIMDETDILKEGEIYVSTLGRDPIIGRVAITRSPALHPGDIQIATAVAVSNDSPLRQLHNCVVFSQRGDRDLPSQLSGGDLDGDQFNIFYDPLIMPTKTVTPADYPRVPPEDIGRPVELQHITDFMVKFMANDQLGRIATLHLALADMMPDGIFNASCLALADLHSTAVDFSKTGIPADASNIPRVPKRRPDFMAPGPRVLLEEGGISFESRWALGDPDEEDPVEALSPDVSAIKYYESDKALGFLYRAIDERTFLDDLQSQKPRNPKSRTDILSQIWDYVRLKTQLVEYSHLVEWAEGVKEEYEATLTNLMCEFSPNPQRPLQEVEVCVGNIIGKGGAAPTKRVRDDAGTMRDRYDDYVRYVQETILRGDDAAGDAAAEALERTMACLAVALDGGLAGAIDALSLAGAAGPRPRAGRRVQPKSSLRSWGYITAILCLRQVERFCAENGIPL